MPTAEWTTVHFFFQGRGYYLLIFQFLLPGASEIIENMPTMFQYSTGVSYAVGGHDRKRFLLNKITHKGAERSWLCWNLGEGGFFFSISERASHQRFVPREVTSHGTEKKALTMPIDKYAEIAGKIWLLICSGWRYLHGAVDSIK